MSMETMDFGTCCACGKRGGDVRNILMLDKRAPKPGTGWGCFVCDLPMDGALAVLCDTCLPIHAPTGSVRWVCDGLPASKRRAHYTDLPPEPFEHDMSKHAEADAAADEWAEDFDEEDL